MELLLRYLSPAPDDSEGWEHYSLPLGNSFLGANIFGIVQRERIQITENATENPGHLGGLNNFAELYFRFPHKDVSGYERGLDLNRALAWVSYEASGVQYRREAFASYPDRALVVRFTASVPGKLSFTAMPEIPYLNDDPQRSKTGEVFAEDNTLILRGRMAAHNLRFEGQLRLITDGTLTADGKTISVSGAGEATAVFVCATNYELRPEVFTEDDPQKKLRDFDPREKCAALMEAACKYPYDELYARHLADYSALFGRVSLDLGETEVPALPTDELLKRYSEGERSRYLEALYFQFGRYLLIESSREGALPANLQGVWNVHDKSPWGAGYWHNINVQMNYWPAFITNLAETFIPYVDYNRAFRPRAGKFAADFIKETVPERYEEGKDYGWTIGTASYAYMVSGPGGHSGPGTGGLTTKLFWDLYDFTRDEKLLRNVTYPALVSMARFLCCCVRNYDGKYLSAFSASPEQIIDNTWPAKVPYYQTVGCAFDQQMIWENAHDLLRCVEILGEDTLPDEDREIIAEVREQIGGYDPVQVGWSGQIKEYREEKFYGEIGEYRHRHISMLVGLYPGTLISSDSPAWRDAAAVSLDKRSDESTGWALAHRLNARARTGDGNRAYKLLSNLIGKRTLPNLWDFHPPFQIDGNLGGSAGVAEMLLQSHETYITPLASVPDDWQSGSFRGLMARGGFEFSVRWQNGCAQTITVNSRAGGVCRLKVPGIAKAAFDFDSVQIVDRDRIEFNTEAGKEYRITAIPAQPKKAVPKQLKVSRDLVLSWDFAEPVNLWRADDSSPVYRKLACGVCGGTYRDVSSDFSRHETVTYKVTRRDEGADAQGAVFTVNHSTRLERDRLRLIVKQINLPNGFTLPPFPEDEP